MQPAPQTHRPLRLPDAGDITWNLLLAAGYAAAGVGGLQFTFFSPNVTTIWPPSGIALAALIAFGPRLLPGVALGAFLVVLWQSGNPVAAAGVAFGNSLAAWTALVLLRGAGFDRGLGRLRDAVTLLAWGAVLAPAVAASIGPASLVAAGILPVTDYASTWGLWWLGDSLGVILFTPLLLLARELLQGGWRAARAGVAWLYVLLQGLMAIAVFHDWAERSLGLQETSYFLLPLGVWLALRHEPRFTAVANAAVFAVAVWGTAAGTGPFAGYPEYGLLLPLHLFIGVLCCTTLLLTAASAERHRALNEARNARDELRSLADLSHDWYWEQDENLRFTRVGGLRKTDTASNIPDQVGKTRWEIPYADVSAERRDALDRLIAQRKPFFDFQMTRFAESGDARIISTSAVPIFDRRGRFRGYRGIGRDITDIKRAEKAIRDSESRFRSLTELSSDWYWEQDAEYRYTFMSQPVERIGVTANEHYGLRRWELPGVQFEPDALARHRAALDARQPFRDFHYRRIYPDGSTRFMSVSGEPVFDDSGAFTGYRGTGRDITAEKSAAQRAARLRDLYAVLSEANDAIIYARDERELFQRTCDVAVRPDRFRFAWIGTISPETGAISPAAVAGDHREYPYRVRLSADPAAGLGAAAASAWGEDAPFVCNDSVADPRNAPWNELLRECGIGSHVSFVLRRGGRPRHSFHLYATERNYFDEELIALLGRLARNISFALDSFDRERAREAADKALKEGRQFFEGVINAIANPIVVKGEDHRFIAFNDTAERFLGQPRESMIGKTDFDLFPPERARFLQDTDDRALASSQPVEYESEYAVGGSQYTMLVRKSALTRPDGSRVLVLVMTDITARKTAEDALRESEQRFRDVAEVAGEYVWENDLQGRFTFLSAKVVEVLGYTAEELTGRSAAEFMPPGEAERVRRWFADHMAPNRSFRGLEHRFVSKSGQTLWLQINGVSRWTRDGSPAGHRGTTRDITELKRNEERISYLATRDPLTELPNRLLFNDRLDQGLINARRSGESVAVLFIDLDRFKNVNDSLGHQIGDLMLKEVAQRMNACIRRGDTIARLGGDEFVIALEHLRKAEDAAQVAGKVIRALTRPIEVAGNTLNTSCSIGVSIFPNDADDAPTLMKNADTAMYYAKEKGRNNFQFFSPDMNVRAVERHQLEISLRRALEKNEFALLYQPQVAFATGAVVGAEALVRWRDPARGLIAPSGFISVAEESGLIEPIGRWVLREACSRAKRWQEQGLPAVRIAVNISPRQMLDSGEFLAYVHRVLDETGLDPRYLELEMTESLLLHNVEENAAVLRRLGKLGVRIAVDDFGTGYSSLSYLKQLPIDSLKVDRTFVRDIETDPEDAAIIRAVIAMAHGLKLRVTAEGVETRGQLEALRALGCDEYQGYLLSRPIPADEFAARFLTDAAVDLPR